MVAGGQTCGQHTTRKALPPRLKYPSSAGINCLLVTTRYAQLHYPLFEMLMIMDFKSAAMRITKKVPKSREILRNLNIKCPLSNNQIVSFQCDHKGRVINDENGITLTIPEGAIRNGDLVMFYIAVDMHGPFVIPSNCKTDLASPYYWIGVSKSYCFQKHIQVEFEHYGACDPSHYQLLICKDDDESYTMRPVDYELTFRVQGGRSLCTYYTDHFCSLCLEHNYKDQNKHHICALYLVPADLENILSQDHMNELEPSHNFLVAVWFSYDVPFCLKRNEQLYKKEGMKRKESYLFSASIDETNEYFFELNYPPAADPWCMGYSRSKKILATDLNFHRDPLTTVANLKVNEKNGLFPPRFIINLSNSKCNCSTSLNTEITITLRNGSEENKVINSPIKFPILVQKCPTPIKCSLNQSKDITQPDHDCYEPKLAELMENHAELSSHWKSIACKLQILEHEIEVIKIDHNNFKDRCREMFKMWLQRTARPCWCHYVEALRAVNLHNLAQKLTARYLKQRSMSADVTVSSIVNVLEDKDNTLNHHRLKRLLIELTDSIVLDCDLFYFAYRLLGIKEVRAIKDSNGSRVDKIHQICEAFLKTESPSWNKLYDALKEAQFFDLADKVKVCYLE